MKFKFLLPLAALMIFSMSCSKSPGKTNTKFKLSIASLTDLGSAGAGGAMLWGKSDKGDMFGTKIQMGSELNLELVNGTWTFWSVAWEGKNNIYNFQGSTRCAKSISTFNGSDAHININLSNATCANSDFSPTISKSSGLYEFPAISRTECNKLSDHSEFNCSGNIGNGAKSISRRLLMPAFKKIAGGAFELTGGALVSACNVGSDYEMADTRLPIGNGTLPAFTVLQSFFTSTVCDETDPKGFIKDNFEFGLRTSSNPNAITYIVEGSCNGSQFSEASCTLYGGQYSAGVCTLQSNAYMKLISVNSCLASGGQYKYEDNKKLRLLNAIPENVFCSGKRVDPSVTTPHIFSSGSGIPVNPYRICKEYQLNLIGANFPSSVFVLQADLDMNVTSIFGDGPVSACLSSKPGANFIPIGGLYDNNCNEVAAAPFSGLFQGNNHTISNIRLHSKLGDMGFIRSGGSIYNLTLNNIEIEGDTKVGGFSGSTSFTLSNLLLKNSKIRGRDIVGGIVGSYAPDVGNIKSLNVKKSFVQIDKSSGHGGGLIGDTGANSSVFTLNKSSFEGVIISSGGANPIAGGLIGLSQNAPLSINESYSSGAMLIHGSGWGGGLIGSANAGVSVQSSYSRMNIAPVTYDIGQAGKLGGLYGSWNIAGSVENSFYYGSIMHPCYTQVSPCSIGAISGGGTSALSASVGTFINQNWFNGMVPTDAVDMEYFESNSTKNNLLQFYTPSLFKNVGSSFLRLAWEDGACAVVDNNKSVAIQSVTKGSITNPIILCSKEQWAEIKNYPTLHYRVADNLGLGEIANTIPSFSGTINGNGYVLGGISNTTSNTSSGIINQNYGKISQVIFAASSLYFPATGSPAAGLISVNKSSGQISDNQFLSVNIKNAQTEMNGVVAGLNYGQINRNKIASVSSFQKSGGLLVGSNLSSGSMLGNRVTGVLNILSDTDNVHFGLVAAKNEGKISETDVSANLINLNDGNTGPATSIGAFLGFNNGSVDNILIRPSTKMNITSGGPTYGHVFGEVGPDSVVKNVLALNEIPLNYNSIMNVQSFAGFSDSDAIYKNSFMLKGQVFRFGPTPIMLNNCMQSGSLFTYTLSSNLDNSNTYMNGFYLSSNSGSLMSSRITTNLSNGVNSFVANFDNGDFVIPCHPSSLIPGTSLLYPITTEADFNHAEVHAMGLRDVGNFQTYCPSSLSVTGVARKSATCKSTLGEFDIVEDAELGTFGYERLYSAYKTMLLSGLPPDSRPIWVMSDEGYPKLFIVD